MALKRGDRWNKWPSRIGHSGETRTHVVSFMDGDVAVTPCGYRIPEWLAAEGVVTNAVTCGKCCTSLGMAKPMTTADLLRLVARGRRAYASGAETVMHPLSAADLLNAEADMFEAAAKIAEGDKKPLYGLLPSWMWNEAGLS